jgi:hypothetical protein
MSIHRNPIRKNCRSRRHPRLQRRSTASEKRPSWTPHREVILCRMYIYKLCHLRTKHIYAHTLHTTSIHICTHIHVSICTSRPNILMCVRVRVRVCLYSCIIVCSVLSINVIVSASIHMYRYVCIDILMRIRVRVRVCL